MTELAEGTSLSTLAGKYLTFNLGTEEYALPILNVHEIIGIMDITPVPRTPKFIRGVINLRGKVIPVLELRKKFSMPAVEDTEKTCIIIVHAVLEEDEVNMGLIVDEVSEVLDLKADEIEPTPSFGGDFQTSFIMGMAKTGDRVRILLDIQQVLAADDAISIAKAVSNQTKEKD